MSVHLNLKAIGTGLLPKDFWSVFPSVQFGKETGTALIEISQGCFYEISFQNNAYIQLASIEMPLNAANDQLLWSSLFDLLKHGYILSDEDFIALPVGTELADLPSDLKKTIDIEYALIEHPATAHDLMQFMTGDDFTDEAETLDNPELGEIIFSHGYSSTHSAIKDHVRKKLFDTLIVDLMPSCRLMQKSATWEKTSNMSLSISDKTFANVLDLCHADETGVFLPLPRRVLLDDRDGILYGPAELYFMSQPASQNTLLESAATQLTLNALLNQIDQLNTWEDLFNALYLGSLGAFGIPYEGIWIYLYISSRAEWSAEKTVFWFNKLKDEEATFGASPEKLNLSQVKKFQNYLKTALLSE